MYEITDYDLLYRPYDKSGGELRHPDFVKLPAKPKGDGLQELLERKRGLEVFGIWCLLLEKTTVEKPENRGKLLNRKEESATEEEIARGISLKRKVELVKYALSVLVSMGWVKNSGQSEQTSANTPPNISKDKISKGKLREDKVLHLDFVFLTEEEHSKLVEKFGATRTADLIEKLNSGIGSKGYKYKSHYFTILNWARREDKENPPTQQISTTKRTAQNRKKIREDYEPYLRAKNTQALKDLRKDKGAVTQIANWLIDEILNERRGTDGATEGNPARKE